MCHRSSGSLIDFCPVYSEFLTWSFVDINFLHFIRNQYGISDLGFTLPYFEFLSLYLGMFEIKIEPYCTTNEDFDQIFLNTGSKTQNVENLSLNLMSGKMSTVLVNRTPS